MRTMSNRAVRFVGPRSAKGLAGLGSPKSSNEFHRCRAEAEMDKALSAGPLSVALRHLELARLHRERRLMLHAEAEPPGPGAFKSIDRTDKEG